MTIIGSGRVSRRIIARPDTHGGDGRMIIRIDERMK